MENNLTSTGQWTNHNQTFYFSGGWLETLLRWGKLLGEELNLTEEERNEWLYGK